MSLIVRDLTVEIGAKTIVDGVTFQVRAGDKVGLVGRNGAGKTTLFRVLGGAIRAVGGTVRRPDATGYLSQDPRSDAVPDDTNCLAHVLLRARPRRGSRSELEKLRLALEEDPSPAQHRASTRERPGALRATPAATPPSPRCASSSTASACAPTASI